MLEPPIGEVSHLGVTTSSASHLLLDEASQDGREETHSFMIIFGASVGGWRYFVECMEVTAYSRRIDDNEANNRNAKMHFIRHNTARDEAPVTYETMREGIVLMSSARYMTCVANFEGRF